MVLARRLIVIAYVVNVGDIPQIAGIKFDVLAGSLPVLPEW